MGYERFTMVGGQSGITMDGKALSQTDVVMMLSERGAHIARIELLEMHTHNIVAYVRSLYHLSSEAERVVDEATQVLEEPAEVNEDRAADEKAAQKLMALSKEMQASGDRVYYKWVRKVARELRKPKP